MPFVVTESCIQCKYTDCVEVCPMDCFVEGPNFLAIDPEGCIDCSVCVGECPVGAIVNAAEATPAQMPFVALNARFARDPRWISITRRTAPLDDHQAWRGVSGKMHLLVHPDDAVRRPVRAGHHFIGAGRWGPRSLRVARPETLRRTVGLPQ